MKVASKQAATAACLGLNFNFGFYLMGYGSVRILRTSCLEKRTVLGQLMRSVEAEAKERAMSYAHCGKHARAIATSPVSWPILTV